jgi:hypothetical protein
MKKIIRKILKEDRKQMFLDRIVQVMKNDFPLFKNMKDYGFYEQLSKDELYYVVYEIFGQIVNLESSYDHINNITIYNVTDKNRNLLYKEHPNGYWVKYQYNENGLKTYTEDSKGGWYKTDYVYDMNQNMIESITMDKYGLFEKTTYDENGNVIYYEDGDGYWEKYEFDERGNLLYYEDSYGEIINNT